MPKPGGSTARGYGYPHQQARLSALRLLVDGQPCTRCGRPMYRSDAAELDLDHDDDRTSYRGLAHRHCNRRAGGQARAKRQRMRKHQAAGQQVKRSRNW